MRPTPLTDEDVLTISLPMLLVKVLERAVHDARGRVTYPADAVQRAQVVESARRFLYSGDAEFLALQVGVDARRFCASRDRLPRPRSLPCSPS